MNNKSNLITLTGKHACFLKKLVKASISRYKVSIILRAIHLYACMTIIIALINEFTIKSSGKHNLNIVRVPGINPLTKCIPSASTHRVQSNMGYHLNPEGRILGQALIGWKFNDYHNSTQIAWCTCHLNINTTRPTMGLVYASPQYQYHGSMAPILVIDPLKYQYANISQYRKSIYHTNYTNMPQIHSNSYHTSKETNNMWDTRYKVYRDGKIIHIYNIMIEKYDYNQGK